MFLAFAKAVAIKDDSISPFGFRAELADIFNSHEDFRIVIMIVSFCQIQLPKDFFGHLRLNIRSEVYFQAMLQITSRWAYKYLFPMVRKEIES
jgi:hypothetical protein